MTPQAFVDWGRRMADAYADAASRVNAQARAHEFDENAAVASDLFTKSNAIASVFNIPGALERLAALAALRNSTGHGTLLSADSYHKFHEVFREIEPVVYEVLRDMWLGEWEFNDSGLMGTLTVRLDPNRPGGWPLLIAYTDSQGTSHGAVLTKSGASYPGWESIELSLNSPASGRWSIQAHMFRWDRQKMAGIVEGGQSEGRHSFYAVKKPSGARAAREVPPPLPPPLPLIQ